MAVNVLHHHVEAIPIPPPLSNVGQISHGKKPLELVDLAIKQVSLENLMSQTPKVNLKIAFFCNIDAPDHNGAIVGGLVKAFEDKTPFITSRSIFLELERTDCFSLGISKDTLSCKGSEWDIYEQVHPEYGNGFLVFIPKGGEREDGAILQSFDLVTDGTLQKITPHEVYSPPMQKVKFEAFQALFSKTPNYSKLIFIDGHGGCGSPIAGLSYENYTKFLSLLTQQKCRGLVISSCYSGGKSSLIHLKDGHGVEFPVITHSIGDLPTRCDHPSLRSLSSYFDGLANLIESGKGETIPNFRKMVQKLEGAEGVEKNPVNLIQVYFPPPIISLGCFRPVGEGGDSFSLTYQTLKMESIQKKLSNLRDIEPEIQINKRFIEVHPIVIDVPLIFESQIPILFSMIPGDAHHYMKEIRLEQNNLLQFVDENGLFFKKYELGVNKLFLIEKLSSEHQIWSDVAVVYDKTGQRCLYLENGQYYFHSSENIEPIPISDFEYRIRLNRWLDETQSSEEAIRRSSGGQQSEKMFQEVLRNHCFGGETLREKFEWFFKTDIADAFKEEALNFLLSCSDRDKELLVDHLLRHKKADLVQKLIDQGTLLFTMDIMKEPLIFYALKGGHDELFYYLLDKIEDVNMRNYRGATLLHVAAGLSKNLVVSTLLSRPGIQVNCTTLNGRTPISFTNDPDIFKQLKNKSADPSISVHNALSEACEFKSVEEVRRLLELGLDPNCGMPPALFHAIRRANSAMIMLLLDYGANPFINSGKNEMDNPYPMPIIEAKRRCHPDIVQRMLNHEGYASLPPEIKAKLQID